MHLISTDAALKRFPTTLRSHVGVAISGKLIELRRASSVGLSKTVENTGEEISLEN